MQRMAGGRFLGRKKLARDFLVEELGHQLEGFARFGKLEVIPEGVGQGFVNHESRFIIGAQQGAMENRGVAQQQVARAGDQQGWRHAVQIREDRRKNGVLWIRAGRIFTGEWFARFLRRKNSGESVQCKKVLGIRGLTEICEDGEHAQRGRQREARLLQFDGDFGG